MTALSIFGGNYPDTCNVAENNIIGRLTIYDALARRCAFETKKFVMQDKSFEYLSSQGYPPRLSHSQHNVKLSIIMSFEQRESLLRRKGRYLRSIRGQCR